jgi:hypothetical protein
LLFNSLIMVVLLTRRMSIKDASDEVGAIAWICAGRWFG